MRRADQVCEVIEDGERCGRPVEARGRCKPHYRKWHKEHPELVRSRSTPVRPFPSADEAFWFYARPGDEPEDHWGWAGKTDQDGYAWFPYKGEKVKAHAYACELLCGPHPSGAQTLHRCGPNPWCVNPNHLAWGTGVQNMGDREADGNTPRGARHGMAVLTDEVVLAIYHSTETSTALARTYGIGMTTVGNIRAGRTWTHLTRSAGEPKPTRRRTELTDEVALAIYHSTDTYQATAQTYEVSLSTVANIRSGRTWAHVTGHGRA